MLKAQAWQSLERLIQPRNLAYVATEIFRLLYTTLSVEGFSVGQSSHRVMILSNNGTEGHRNRDTQILMLAHNLLTLRRTGGTAEVFPKPYYQYPRQLLLCDK